MKKIFSVILVLALLVTSVSTANIKTVCAATALDVDAGEDSTVAAVSQVQGIRFNIGDIRYSGDIGNIKWGIDGSGVFAFYHSDATPEQRITNASGFQTYSDPTKVPWYRYRSYIQYITLANLDSYFTIPDMDYFFYECKNLLAVVMLPAVVTSMNYTFYMDIKLHSVGCVLPETKKMNYCFQGCKELDSVVAAHNPSECDYAFYRTSCQVIVLPGIYDEKSKLAIDSKCGGYYKMNSFEPTLYGISKVDGSPTETYRSDSCVSSIRYGQSIADAEVGSTGGLRLVYSYGSSSFCRSVYLPCQITKVIKSPRTWQEVLNVGTYKNVLDISMQAKPSEVFAAVVPSSFYRTTYKSIVVEKCQLELCKISLSDNSFVYDGAAKMPGVSLTNPYNEEKLMKGRDFTVFYEDHTNAGTARVTVTGIGNYTGSVTKDFQIKNAELSGGVNAEGFVGTYDGNGHGIQVRVSKPSQGVTVKYGNSPENCSLVSSPVYENAGIHTVYYQVSADNYNTFTGSQTVRINARNVGDCSIDDIVDRTYDGKAHTPDPVVSDGVRKLVKGTDYTVSYSSNINAGTASVTVTGKGNYTGTKTKMFTIRPLSLKSGSGNGAVRTGNVVYTGNVQNPDISIVLGSGYVTLKAGRDYEITGNTAVNTGFATLSVSGRGNYTGSISAKYTISAFPMEGSGEKMVLDQEELVYTGYEVFPSVKIQDPKGKVLKENTDYTLIYKDAVNVGTGKVQAVFQGNYSGSITKSFYIKPAPVSDVELCEDEFVYNGKEHRPVLKEYSENVDYTVTYRDNTDAGMALAIFSFCGNYTGTVTKEFEICPRKMKEELEFPNAEQLVFRPGLTVSDSNLSERENEYGSFCWNDPKQEVEVNNEGYAVRFTPNDRENYDWSSVPGWCQEEQSVIRRIPLVVEKAKGILPEFSVTCLAEGDFLSESEISWNREEGEFFWPDEPVSVSPDITNYPLNFVPPDCDNYDWTDVGQWDEQNQICRITSRVAVISNPEASCVKDGDKLALSVLTSRQQGATYEWKDPDIVVTKSDSDDNRYEAMYHYEGHTIVRMVQVPVWKEPEIVRTPGPSSTGRPSVEPTPVCTAEGVVEPTPACTAEGVVEPTPVCTAEGTVEPTPVCTTEGTVEPTPVCTAEVGVKPAETLLPTGEPVETLLPKHTQSPVKFPYESDRPKETEMPWKTAEPTQTPVNIPAETWQPHQTEPPKGDPSETKRPKETHLPSETTVPAEIPRSTPKEVFWPEKTEEYVPSISDQVSGEEDRLDTVSNEPAAYDMIHKFISANLNADRGILKTDQRKVISILSKIKVKWIRKRKTVIHLKKGGKLHLKVKGFSNKVKPVWKLKGKKIVSVSKNGVIKAKKKGSTCIIVRIKKKRYICMVTVKR